MLEGLLRWLLYISLFLILIPSGSVNFVPLHHIALAIYAISACAALLAPLAPAVRVPFSVGLAVGLLIIAWVWVQITGFAHNPFSNPIWSKVGEIYNYTPAYISIAPGDSRSALIAALLPFAVFLSSLLLCRNDDFALRLVVAIAIGGIAICMFGLLQFKLAPDMLVLDVKRHYMRNLTAVFVNRNTAANYIGMTLILTIGLASQYLQKAGFRSFVACLLKGTTQTSAKDAFLIVILGIIAGAEFSALVMTQSRAGTAATMVSVTVLLAILIFSAGVSRAGRPSRPSPVQRRKRILGVAAFIVLMALFGLFFTGLVAIRAVERGGDDLRFCFFPQLLVMARDHWLVGTGLGTFADIYPAYRNPACGMDGVLTLAHNVYLEGWITMGLIFFPMLLAVVGTLLFILLKGIRSRRRLRWLPASGLAVLILQLLHNGVDFSIQNPGVGAVFAALMGATVVVSLGRQLSGGSGFSRASYRPVRSSTAEMAKNALPRSV